VYIKRNALSCMTTTTHTMVVKLSHETFVSLMMYLFREATTSFSFLSLSPPHHQKSDVALHGRAYETADVYQCTASRPITFFWRDGGFQQPFSAMVKTEGCVSDSLWKRKCYTRGRKRRGMWKFNNVSMYKN
jgi:hypothetical protein